MNWELLDNAPDYLQPVADLIRWASNEEHRAGTTYLAFIDLIGYTRENFGDTLNNPNWQAGYVEADYLADALKVWANNPYSVESFISDWELYGDEPTIETNN